MAKKFKIIGVSLEVYNKIRKRGDFTDTIDDVMRRILKIKPSLEYLRRKELAEEPLTSKERQRLLTYNRISKTTD